VSRPRPAWYLRRLRGMSVTEMAHRTLDVGRRRVWARRQVRPGEVAPLPAGVVADRAFSSPLPASVRTRVAPHAASALVRAADTVLDGTWTALGRPRADSAAPDWFRDPVTGRRAPDRQLAFRVNHRDEAETGNIKQVWEMSRHHHLTVLAAAWWLTEDERYAETAAQQLRSWWRANPFLSGVHWTSGIEAGIRLISWVWIRRLLDEWPKVGDLFEHNEDAIRQIAWHQEFLAAFPSRGSSANNHVVAEAAGRLAAACGFPWYARTSEWRRKATSLLERELAANTFDDGLNRELATDYHRFVLELGLLAAVEADAHGHDLSEATWQRLVRMLDAGAAILDATGRAPRQGDGDEGRALVVDDLDQDSWATVLGTGAALVGAADWWPAFDGGVQAHLVGALGRARLLPRPPIGPRRFPDAGLVLLRSRPEDGHEIWCRCDGGPHGFLSIAAHAHADALSL
jgi:Heparinase II/III N-terminus/Heparinase II/III-like protein